MESDYGKLYFETGIDNSKLRQDAQQTRRELHNIGKTAVDEGNRIDGTFKKIGATMVGVFAVSKLKDFVSQVANVRGQFQQLEMAFSTMLGSADKAKTLMDQLIKTASTTPFNMSEVANGAKQLLAYGVSADEVNNTLIRLGDIAAGLSIPLNDLTYLYGTTMTQGRLFTQDLRQFMGRGIPLADELAKQFGVTKDKVGELVTAGKVGFSQVKKAIEDLTNEGSKFGGLMEAQAHTITGQISNIEDAIEQMFNDIGKSSEGIINDSLSLASKLVENWETVGRALLVVISAYGAYKAAVVAVWAVQKISAIWGTVQAFLSLTKSITSAKDAMLLFNMATKANPLGLVLGILASVATAYTLFRESVDAAAKAEMTLNSIKSEAAKKTAEETEKLNTLVAAAKNEKLTLDERKSAIRKLNEIVPNYNAKLDATTGKYKENKKALDDYLASLVRKYELEGAKEQLAELGKRKAKARSTYNREIKKAEENNPWSKDDEVIGGSFAAAVEGGIGATSVRQARIARKRVVVQQFKTDMADIAVEEKAILKDYGVDMQKEAIKVSEQSVATGSDKSGKNDKSDNERERIANEAAERNKAIAEYADTVKNQQTAMELDIRQEKIDLLEDGYEKELEQINLNYDRLIVANRKRLSEMLDDLKDKKVLEWLNKNPKATKEEEIAFRASLSLTDKDLTAGQKLGLSEYEKVASEQKRKATQDLYTKLLGEFQDYEARRTQINADFDKKRKDLESMPADIKGREQAIEELEKKRKESIKSVNDEEISKMRESSTLFIDLFGDAADKSDKEIRKIITETEELLSYLKNTKTSDITPDFGFTTEQLKALKASPEQIKAITEQLERLKQAAKSSNPFKQLAEDLKNLFSKNKDDKGESTEAKLKKLGASASETADLIGGIASKLSDMYDAAGNTSIAEAMETLSDAMTSVSNIGRGFAQGGVVGGITAAAGEAIGIVTKAFQASARHAEALKQIMREVTAQQRAYNLALLEQNLQYEQAATVFGNLDYKKAINAIGVLEEAYVKLNSELRGTTGQQKKFGDGIVILGKRFGEYSRLQQDYSGLADIQIKTGHKKTGFLGWGKGKDLYSSILDVYPQLVDSAGNFNKKLAESIIASREFNGEGKEALQNMIDLYDKAEEAAKLMKDYLSGIFGELGNSMSDALVDAFRNGTDAGKAFGDSVKKMLEDIGKQMIFSTMFDSIIEQANDQMLKTMKSQSLTTEQKFNEYVNILDTMTSGILNQQETYNGLLKRYQKMAAGKGVEIFTQDNTKSQNATVNGLSKISYEQADNLMGLATARNIKLGQIDNRFVAAVDNFAAMRSLAVSTNAAVLDIRNLLALNNSYTEEIGKSTRSMYNEFSGKIDRISKNIEKIA